MIPKMSDTYVEGMTLENDKVVESVCVSEDRLFSCDYGNTIKVWDWKTGAHIQTLQGHTKGVNSMCTDGTYLFSASADNTIKVWYWKSRISLHTLQGHTESVCSVCVSGDRLFSGSWDKAVKVWDWRAGVCLRTMEGHESLVYSVCVLGDRLFSGSGDETIKVWDWRSGACVQTLEGQDDGSREVYSLCVSGDRLFSGSSDETIKVWDLESGACVQTLEGHTGAVLALCVSEDRLFSGSDDKTIKVWNMAGECVQTLQGHTSYVESVCVSGGRIFSGSGDNTIKVWELGVGVEITDTVSFQDGIDQVFADADIVDVDALDLPDPGHSGGESKTSDYIKMGYVSPYKEELDTVVPDFSVFNCYHERLDPRLRCKIAKEVQKCREDVQKVERLRWTQRRAVGAKRSVYLFLCVKNTNDILQPDLNVYVYCAFALQSLGWKHRMVIYDERASHESLLETAARLQYPVTIAFLKQNVVCMPYVNNYDKLKTAVKDIEDNEEIALVYLSAHGDKRGILYGPWDGGKDIPLSQRGLISFGKELHTNMSSDCQVFLNSCYAGKSTAIVLMLQLDGHIVLASSDWIPSGKVVHRFQIDAGNDRLYFSAQCPTSEIKAYSTHFVDGGAAAASVHPQRRLERQSSGNPRPNQRRRRDEYNSGSETESEDEPIGYTNVSFRF